MGIPLTYITTHLPPTEMWVEARTWRDYEVQGFELVGYEPGPEWLRGCYSGRAKIRMKGNGEDYTYAPELCALHAAACAAIGANTPSYSKRAASNSFHAAHSALFGAEVGYHGVLMKPLPGECLEDVKARVVAGLRFLARQPVAKASMTYWLVAAADLEAGGLLGRVSFARAEAV